MKQVAIVGGGYAGMAAAVAASARGAQVTVLEAGPVLGGRARRVELDGLALDNGQHLVVGAYRELLRLMAEVGVAERTAFVRQPLDLDLPGHFRLACPRLPAPWHALVGLLGARGLDAGARWAAIRTMTLARLAGHRLRRDTTVADWLASQRQPEILVRCLWEPLTLAALNTPIATASAQVLLNVLRDSLAGRRADSDFLLPRIDLSTAFPEAAARHIAQRGGRVLTGALVRRISQQPHGWQVDRLPEQTFDALIVALPPHRLSMLADSHPALATAAASLADWEYQPIYTVYLRYPPTTRLAKPMLGLVGGIAQWAFDRGATHGQHGLIAVVVSAEGPHQTLDQTALAQAVAEELTRTLALPAPLASRVIAEKRATFACTPDLRRPANRTDAPGLLLAGDYTAGDYPATLEGAVRSGVQAAALL
ncbi:hydroxysqualene dehydroxylase HpnE [Chitinimonas lacunae]|uniref:Hydroxysqualene dehydroxylase HpnE n=1 Tax=Chitinimonas lacunae TaxID=1963018 RepID=A0ABV8MWE4_9NEIS